MPSQVVYLRHNQKGGTDFVRLLCLNRAWVFFEAFSISDVCRVRSDSCRGSGRTAGNVPLGPLTFIIMSVTYYYDLCVSVVPPCRNKDLETGPGSGNHNVTENNNDNKQ